MLCGYFCEMDKMMLPNFESRKDLDGISDANYASNEEFLHDIEEISKALYVEIKSQKNNVVDSSNLMPKLRKKPHFGVLKAKSKPGFGSDGELLRGEHRRGSSSIWGWKPFKALSHIRQRKFECYFFCHVHCVESLAAEFEGVSLSVCWKRKDNVLRTKHLRVEHGMVDFEETLVSKCTVYGAKSGSANFVKYEPKPFLLYVSIVGSEGLDVGKNWVDLTRLLPLTVEELEEDKCSGKWLTSFKLAGKARGATLHVSFGFLVTKDSVSELVDNLRLPLLLDSVQNGLRRMSFVAGYGSSDGSASLRRAGSVPSSLAHSSCSSYQSLDAKFGFSKEVFDFCNSINMLYGKLEEGSSDTPAKFDVIEYAESPKLAPDTLLGPVNDFGSAKHEDDEFSVTEKRVESEFAPQISVKLDDSTVEDFDGSTVEVIDIDEIFKGDGISSDEETESTRKEVSSYVANELMLDKSNVLGNEESKPEELVLDLHRMSISESGQSGLLVDLISDEFMVKPKARKLVKSLSLDDVAKTVAEDFLNLLHDSSNTSTPNSNTNLESPRERLLREFEDDMMTFGSSFMGVDVQEDEVLYDYADAEFADISSLDCYETVELSPVMEMAGNPSAYQLSRSKMQAKSLERLETQSLMQKWGLNEEAFLSSPHYSTGGFGSPIFVPSEPEEPAGLPHLGEGLEPVLELKDGGLLRSMSPLVFRDAKNCGRLILQASKLVVLPVEMSSDIIEILQSLASVGVDRLPEQLHTLMPLEELSGKIVEQLALEASYEAEFDRGIGGDVHIPGYNQFYSGVPVADVGSEFRAAKDLSSLVLDALEVLTIEGLKVQCGMSSENAPSSIMVKSAFDATLLHKVDKLDGPSNSLDFEVSVNHADELLGLSISLDEWLRLDAGVSGDGNEVNDHTLKLLRAHHAKSSLPNNIKSVREESMIESSKCGILGDSIIVALLTQLRDPLRNYEPVGAPMLGLVQVERVFRPVSRISEVENGENRQDHIPVFRLKDVHVAGLNLESDITECWASKRQHQSGSRWLLSSGLTKKRGSNFSKSKSIVTLPTRLLRRTRTRSLLWSFSRPIHGVAADSQFRTWECFTRNPDIIFP